jgi:hypothetical protein
MIALDLAEQFGTGKGRAIAWFIGSPNRHEEIEKDVQPNIRLHQ